MTAEHASSHGERSGRRGNPTETNQPSGGRGGRPRDPAIEEAIIRAVRGRLVRDGYAAMTISDIVADAGVTRSALRRRWADKYALVVDALRYGLRKQREAHSPLEPDRLPPRGAFVEAVRRLDPCSDKEHSMVLHGSLMSEATREPGLLRALREYGVWPRCEEFLLTVISLQRRGAVREDVDLETLVTLCFGSCFGDHLRTGRNAPTDHADRIAAIIWPVIAVRDQA